jgi:hypothetical protein
VTKAQIVRIVERKNEAQATGVEFHGVGSYKPSANYKAGFGRANRVKEGD